MPVAHEPFFTVEKYAWWTLVIQSYFSGSEWRCWTIHKPFTWKSSVLWIWYSPGWIIRDQVIEKCLSHRLRRKRLEMQDLTLDLLRRKAQTIEFRRTSSNDWREEKLGIITRIREKVYKTVLSREYRFVTCCDINSTFTVRSSCWSTDRNRKECDDCQHGKSYPCWVNNLHDVFV